MKTGNYSMDKYVRFSFVTLMFLLGSCGGSNGANHTDIIFTDILCPKQFYSSTKNESVNLVVNSSDELLSILNMLNLPEIEIADIDYALGSLVLVYGGYRGTGNEWVEISSISKAESGEVTINYNDFSADFPGCGGDTAESYSICIVQTDIHFSEASFEHQTLNSCESEGGRP